ncbi:Dihydroorotate dehydrogenase (quinone), mitochondrial, partial [Ascosphaera aggregata]
MSLPIYRRAVSIARFLPVRGAASTISSRLASTGIRHASSSSSSSAAAAATVPPVNKSSKRNYRAVVAAASVISAVGYFYLTDNRSSAHQYIIPPLVRFLIPDGERAHEFTINFLKNSYKFGLHPRERGNPDAYGDLMVNIFGYNVVNPIGIAAGLDKNADIPDPFFAIGPGIVEVGGITPLPQPGNPGVRIFRIPSQQALINRCGLNSKGADYVAETLRARVAAFAKTQGFGSDDNAVDRVLDGQAGVPPGSLTEGKLFAVQIAKNKTTPNDDLEAIERDYTYCVDRLGKYADILVVNVSSPNMPGLRDLQATNPLTQILTSVVKAAEKVDRRTKPFVM